MLSSFIRRWKSYMAFRYKVFYVEFMRIFVCIVEFQLIVGFQLCSGFKHEDPESWDCDCFAGIEEHCNQYNETVGSGMLIVTSSMALPQTEKCSGGLTVEHQLIS